MSSTASAQPHSLLWQPSNTHSTGLSLMALTGKMVVPSNAAQDSSSSQPASLSHVQASRRLPLETSTCIACQPRSTTGHARSISKRSGVASLQWSPAQDPSSSLVISTWLATRSSQQWNTEASRSSPCTCLSHSLRLHSACLPTYHTCLNREWSQARCRQTQAQLTMIRPGLPA